MTPDAPTTRTASKYFHQLVLFIYHIPENPFDSQYGMTERRIEHQPYIRALERFKAFATQKRKKSCLSAKQEKLGFYHIKDVSSSFIWSEHPEK